MSLTINGYWLPVVATILLLAIMLRPYRSSGSFDFGAIFRLFWLLPIALVWIAYLVAVVAEGGSR